MAVFDESFLYFSLFRPSPRNSTGCWTHFRATRRRRRCRRRWWPPPPPPPPPAAAVADRRRRRRHRRPDLRPPPAVLSSTRTCSWCVYHLFFFGILPSFTEFYVIIIMDLVFRSFGVADWLSLYRSADRRALVQHGGGGGGGGRAAAAAAAAAATTTAAAAATAAATAAAAASQQPRRRRRRRAHQRRRPEAQQQQQQQQQPQQQQQRKVNYQFQIHSTVAPSNPVRRLPRNPRRKRCQTRKKSDSSVHFIHRHDEKWANFHERKDERMESTKEFSFLLRQTRSRRVQQERANQNLSSNHLNRLQWRFLAQPISTNVRMRCFCFFVQRLRRSRCSSNEEPPPLVLATAVDSLLLEPHQQPTTAD